MAGLPESVRAAHLADSAFVRLPATVPPWTRTPLCLAEGDELGVSAGIVR